MPATSIAAMSASLWALLTKVMRTRGLSTASVKAWPGSRPAVRASFGMQKARIATAPSSSSRSAITEAVAEWKVMEAMKPSSIKNSGPYGAGVLPQRASTGLT